MAARAILASPPNCSPGVFDTQPCHQAPQMVTQHCWSDSWRTTTFDRSPQVAPSEKLLFGRQAKRQRQRENRRMGRAAAKAAKAPESDGDSAADLTDTTASLNDAASSVGSDIDEQLIRNQDIQVLEEGKGPISLSVALLPRWDRYNLSVEVLEESQCLDAPEASSLPAAHFGTTPEFEEFRLAYRQFRLGSGFGARGEASDSPKYEDCHSGPWQQMSFWSSLRESISTLPAQAA